MRRKDKISFGFLLLLSISIGLITLLPFQTLAEGDEDQMDFTGDPVAGEKLMREIDCYQCHVIGDEGGEVGPRLTNVALRRSRKWLFEWLEDPSLSRPATGMPVFEWQSEEEIINIVSYLYTLLTPVNSQEILKENDLIKAGEKLVEAYDCRACHTIKTGGMDIYPNLTHAGDKLKPEWDKKFLKDPEAWDIYTFMPNFHLTDQEIEAIVAYVLSPNK